MAKRIITVSREFGSGGRSIGKAVADHLHYTYYDKELVAQIAKESGMAESFVLEEGEYACAKSSFIFNMDLNAGLGINNLPLSDQLYIVQHRIITELADKGPCVIVGRCADYILRSRNDCLHTFFHAEMAFRSDRIVRLYGERELEPERRLTDKDDQRKTYYRHYTGRPWGVCQNYHLSLNTSVIGLDRCVEIVVNAAQACA